MQKSGCRIFTTVMRFGNFELDCATAELYKDGRRLKLQDQPAHLLVLLASRAGTLVTRADIQETLWADGQFVEFEHAINVAVKTRYAGSAAWAPMRPAITPKAIAVRSSTSG